MSPPTAAPARQPWRTLGTRWRVLDSGAGDGVTNMATDCALLARARRTGEATLRVYGWSRPTLSLGRHERARERFDPLVLADQGVDVVRRPTGGRALFHHREVTYSVTAPVGTSTLAESYRAINVLLSQALASIGIVVEMAAPATRALRPEGAACFAEPSAGELLVRGAKLVGSAQLREDGALLQHGSILLADDQPRIASLQATADGSSRTAPARTVITPPPMTAAATVEGLLGRPVPYAEVRDALFGALGATLDATEETMPLDSASLRDDLARLVIAFADPEWTWRR